MARPIRAFSDVGFVSVASNRSSEQIKATQIDLGIS